MKNILGREVPDFIEGYGKVTHYNGYLANTTGIVKKNYNFKTVTPEDNKLYTDLSTLMDKLPLKDGMTVSFHHHLRNGDYVLNLVMAEIAKRGYKDITLVASSIFPCHKPVVEYMEKGIVTQIYAGYMSGPVAQAISEGKLQKPAVMHTHGGRARIMETGEVEVDIAFVAAPTSDEYGNINGVDGKSACGALGYAHSDVENAKLVETTYGEALFELAVQESKVDELCEEAQAVIDIFKDNEDLVNVLKSPKVEKKEKEQLIENIFKKCVSEDITGLLVIMVSKDRQTKIVSTLEYFIKRIYEYKKIGVAFVTTARPLTDNQKLSIVRRLLSTTDYVDLKMNYDIDESLIAGMVIRIGDRVVDSSIKHKIDELTRNLKNIQLA